MKVENLSRFGPQTGIIPRQGYCRWDYSSSGATVTDARAQSAFRIESRSIEQIFQIRLDKTLGTTAVLFFVMGVTLTSSYLGKKRVGQIVKLTKCAGTTEREVERLGTAVVVRGAEHQRNCPGAQAKPNLFTVELTRLLKLIKYFIHRTENHDRYVCLHLRLRAPEINSPWQFLFATVKGSLS